MDRGVKVLVVEETAQLRAVVKSILSDSPGFELAGEASTARQAFDLADRTRPDLILLDVDMVGIEGRAAIQLIADTSPNSRVIAWSHQEGADFVTGMIAAGAFGYLLKGVSPRELGDSLKWAANGQSVLARDLTSTVMTEISRLYRNAEQRAEELETSYLTTVMSLAAALETKDDQTGNHARRVRDYATIIAKNFDPGMANRESLVFGFLLHDVGKIGIPEQILLKPGPLDDSEWEVMRQHPLLGAHILESASFLQGDAIDVVTSHHERWDGNGYPHRLAKEKIPVGARLFAVADTFDAMTSDRPYRKGLPVEVAVAEIEKNSGTQFDPDVVKAFIASEAEVRARMESDDDIVRAEVDHWQRVLHAARISPGDQSDGARHPTA